MSSITIASLGAIFALFLQIFVNWLRRPVMDLKFKQVGCGEEQVLRIYNNGKTVMERVQIRIELGLKIEMWNLIEKEFFINPDSHYDVYIGYWMCTTRKNAPDEEIWWLISENNHYMEHEPIHISVSAERVPGKHISMEIGDMPKNKNLVLSKRCEIQDDTANI
ncbi:MAG: hypothetical protein J6V08_06030 [Candidatus Methanomethylophilaceae archaeon]|nr:hypothetical protein [Candidatus Methanomethylophilaceae archaeon]